MARKPNYSFEKRERERAKAAKKAARLAAKAEKAARVSWKAATASRTTTRRPPSARPENNIVFRDLAPGGPLGGPGTALTKI